MDNAQLYIDVNALRKDVKDRGGWLVVLLTLVSLSVFNNLSKESYFEKISHYIDFGLRIVGMLAILIIFWFLLFKRKSKKSLIINDISLIKIDKGEFETEVTLQFSNKREIELNFRNLENQLEPFLEEIKKRNTRLKIKHI
jgi:hypothetical protein